MNLLWQSTYPCLSPVGSTRGKTIFFTSPWTCCSSTLIVSRRSGSIANASAWGSVLGKLHNAIWHLSFEPRYQCCGHLHWLYRILRTGSLFAWMIEHTTMVKCDFLYAGHITPPHAHSIYMRKSKNILPLVSAYFLWEGAAFSKSISARGFIFQKGQQIFKLLERN